MAIEPRNISTIEKGLVIGACVVVDLIQIGLDLIAQLGVVLNRFIDVYMELGIGLYFQMSGYSIAQPKRLISLIGTFVAEEIPDVDALPFWTMEVIYLYSLMEVDKVLDKVPGGSSIKVAEDKLSF